MLLNILLTVAVLPAQTFHVLTPIKCNQFKVNLVRRLLNSGAVLKQSVVEDPLSAELFACTCENYLHYGWCIHVCLHAFGSGVFLDYPPLLNPRKIKALKNGRACSATTGRPPAATPGGALSRE